MPNKSRTRGMDIDTFVNGVVFHPAFNTVVSLSIGAFVPVLFGFYGREAANKATTFELEKQITKLESEKSESQKKNSQYEAKIRSFTDRALIRLKYTIDATTGDMMAGGLHFCTRCFNDGSEIPKEIQMREFGGKFRCTNCDPRQIVTALIADTKRNY
jgi:hypothetical protein